MGKQASSAKGNLARLATQEITAAATTSTRSLHSSNCGIFLLRYLYSSTQLLVCEEMAVLIQLPVVSCHNRIGGSCGHILQRL